MRALRTAALLAGVFIGLLSTVSAQGLCGSVTGVVKDTSGAVLPGVTVEAASPALIEKVRSVVTDGSGQYQIVDLRPGAYAVTFSLAGFSTVKREGIELTGSFSATINAEMKVGAVDRDGDGERRVADRRRPGTTQQRVIQQGRHRRDSGRPQPSATRRAHSRRDRHQSGCRRIQHARTDVSSASTAAARSDMRVTANGVNLGNIGSPGQLSA